MYMPNLSSVFPGFYSGMSSIDDFPPINLFDLFLTAVPLRSLGSRQLIVSRLKNKQDQWAFSYSAAHTWKLLIEEIRNAANVTTFKIRRKTITIAIT